MRSVFPDAVLFRIDADGVRASGRADLTLANDLSVDYRFQSPAQSKRPANVPLGVDWEENCILRVIVEKGTVSLRPMTGWECTEKLAPRPSCTPAQIWQKAIAAGAPKDAVAELGYRINPLGRRVWYFSIKGTEISEMFDDDC